MRADDIISEEVYQTPPTMEDDIPSDTDTFGSDISVASSTSDDDESDLELDRKMQPDYDSSGDDEDFDIPVIAKPVASIKEREAIDIDVRKWCPTVYNQHSEGSCLAIASVDVCTGVLRKEGVLDEKAAPLSPQPLIDSGITYDTDDRRLDLFVSDLRLGLPTVTSYPFLGMERPVEEWDWSMYRRSKHKRHNISGMYPVDKSDDPEINHNTDGPVVDALEANFRSDGKQYPLVGVFDITAITDGAVAKKYAIKHGMPYHHEKVIKQQSSSGGEGEDQNSEEKEQVLHASVVVGYYNKPEDCLRRYVTIKNSYGKDWGNNGHTNLGLDTLDSLIVPDYDPVRWAKIKEVEAEKRAKKETEKRASRDVDVGAGIQAWGTLARSKHSEEVSPFTTLESSLQALHVHSSDEADGNDETYASWDEEYSQSNDENAYSDVKDSTVLVSQPHLDEIRRSVAENGGIDSLLICIDDSGEQGNNIFAKACCSLLSELAGSDFNKSAIVEKGGLNRLITLCSRLSDDPSVLQEVMTIICTLCLQSPRNATLAMEAGAGDLAIQAMQKFPEAYQLQKNSCLMVRNLVARNAENRSLLLSNGIERIIRNAKENHKSCRDAATAALRDLGLDNYNS